MSTISAKSESPATHEPAADESVVARADAFEIREVTNPRWANAESTMISCIVTFPNHPLGYTEPMPFTADPRDSEAHGRSIYARILDGEFGPVADYVAPSDDLLAAAARAKRDELLRESEWTQARDQPMALSEEWTPYRQALRDISDQPGFPRSIDWPIPPQ